MPVSLPSTETFTAQSVSLQSDGSVQLVIGHQIVPSDGRAPIAVSTVTYNMPPADAQAILSSLPDATKSIYRNFGGAIDAYLVAKGVVPAGTIS
jgi:type IV pilus biogenesis protein CpaD/CtpE